MCITAEEIVSFDKLLPHVRHRRHHHRHHHRRRRRRRGFWFRNVLHLLRDCLSVRLSVHHTYKSRVNGSGCRNKLCFLPYGDVSAFVRPNFTIRKKLTYRHLFTIGLVCSTAAAISATAELKFLCVSRGRFRQVANEERSTTISSYIRTVEKKVATSMSNNYSLDPLPHIRATFCRVYASRNVFRSTK